MTSRRSRSTRYQSERGATRRRAQGHYARVRQRKATRSQRRTLGALAFIAAFGLGLASGSSGQSAIRKLLDESGSRVDQIEVLGHTRLDAREIASPLRRSGSGAIRGCAMPACCTARTRRS